MILHFMSKRNASGNRKTMEIDTEKKEVIRSYNPRYIDAFVEIREKDFGTLSMQCQLDGYKVIYK